MALADELEKLDNQCLTIISRTFRSIIDLRKRIITDAANKWGDIYPGDDLNEVPKEIPAPLVSTEDDDRVSIDKALENWKWNETTFTIKGTVSDVSKVLQEHIQRIDEELRKKTADYTDAQNKIQNLRRSNEGTLLVKSLDPIASKMALVTDLSTYQASKMGTDPIYVDTENIMTVLIVVRTSDVPAFKETYDNEEYVIPKSISQLDHDNDFVCFAVSILRQKLDDYKAYTKERGFYLRDFNFDKEGRTTALINIKNIINDYIKQLVSFTDFLNEQFSMISNVWFHLRAVRVFVESKLLYGIPAKFSTYLIKTSIKNTQQIHKGFEKIYFDGIPTDDNPDGNEADEYHPYVSFIFNIASYILQA